MNPVLRANPVYRFHGWGTLPEALQDSLRQSTASASVAGVLVSAPDSSLPDKVVGPEGAELFARLQEPAVADLAPDVVTQLVLDGVLEIRTADAGFISGPAAFERLSPPPDVPPAADRLSRLSLAALEYAARLPLPGVSELAGRLYGYHRLPLTSRWMRAYPGPAAVLGLMRSTGMSARWDLPAGPTADVAWLCWTRTGTRGTRTPMPYKLYVSPHIETLPEVMPAFIAALDGTGARHFKLGVDAAGLLRPDKLVVYLRDVDELQDVADRLAGALAGVRPHGVPFSAQLAGDGLLSWGGDPSPDAGPVGAGQESWRMSVCRRLAEHLVAVKTAPARRTDPVRYALARLAADGIRLPTFAPDSLTAPRVPAPWT